jgi:hypothetical protein
MTVPADDDPYAVAVAARAAALAEVEHLWMFHIDGCVQTVDQLRTEVQRLEADLTVAVHEATVARARLAGHHCGRMGQGVAGGPD